MPVFRTFIVGSLILRISAPALAAGQLDGEIDDVLRITTRLVQVNVVVTGQRGTVGDLTAADFTVFDEGIERDIAVFNVTRTAREDPAVRALPAGVVSNRLNRLGRQPESVTLLLLDRLNTAATDQAFVDSQARNFLNDAAGTADAIAAYELREGGLTMLAGFTSSPEELRRALESNRPAHSLAFEASSPTTGGGLASADSATAAFEDEFERFYVDFRVRQTADALEAASRYLSRFPGRKNLVWIAAEFPFPYKAWQDARFNSSSFVQLPPKTLDRIDEVYRLIIEADIAVYPIHAPGLAAASTEGRAAREYLWDNVDLLLRLAEVTGGRASFNTNGLATRVEEAVRDTEITYTVGFYVTEDAEDTDFHEIEVVVDRDDVDVRHRRGYFGFGGTSNLETPDRNLSTALTRVFDETGLGLVARAEPVGGASQAWDVAIAIDVDEMGFERVDNEWAGALTLGMLYYTIEDVTRRADEDEDDEDDPIRVVEPMTLHVRLSESQLESAGQTGFILNRVVETEGHRGYLRIAVQDVGTGATGSLWLPLGIEE
jgi:VWFA-related protein